MTILQTEYGYQLAITEQVVPGADTTAIILHGFMSHRQSNNAKAGAQSFNAMGISTLRPDFYGRGESDGAFGDLTIAKGVENVQACLAHIRQRDKAQKIILTGGSYGGLIALHAAAELGDQLSCLILRAPVSDWRACWAAEWTPDNISSWQDKGYYDGALPDGRTVRFGIETFYDLRDDDVYGKIAPRISVPVLIGHGNQDETVPLTQSERLSVMLADSKLVVLNGADHGFSDPVHVAAFQAEIEKFLFERFK